MKTSSSLIFATAMLSMAVSQAAVAGRHHGDAGGKSDGGDHLFISPMGEPFRGQSERSALIAAWFNAADSNHDGKLSLTEFRADADRFFKILDTNHDGEVDPAELEHYEQVIVPEIAGSFGSEGMQGASRFGMLDLPEPVASADTDFNRGVSEAEFLRAATARFRVLDFDHHGQLTLAGLPQKPPKLERHHENDPPPQLSV
jgi:hypothetical protein